MKYLELKSKSKLTDVELGDAISEIITEMDNGYTRNQAINHIAICYDVSSYYLAEELYKTEIN